MQRWTLRQEILLHILVILVFLLPYVFLQNLVFNYQAMLLLMGGGLIGTFLPDVDHLLYALFLKPGDITSQRVHSKLAARDVKGAIVLLFTTRDERRKLVFHTVFFQCLFVLFAFLVITSNGTLFGRGLVLGFLLSLLVDQIVDLRQKQPLARWASGLPISFTPQQFDTYLLVHGVLLLLLGYVF